MSISLATSPVSQLPQAGTFNLTTLPAARLTGSEKPIHAEKSLMDISVTDALQGLTGGVVNSFLGAGGILGTTMWHTKDAVINGYKALKADNHIGPNVKRLIGGLGIPGTAILLQPLAAVSGAIYGLGQGFYSGVFHGFAQSVHDTFDGIKEYDKYAAKGIDFLELYEPEPLPDGKIPFDITLRESAHAFAGGITSPFMLAPAVAGITLWRQWKGYYRALQDIWKDPDSNIVWKASLTGLATLALPLASPLALTAGALWGLGEGVVEGYQNGVVSAWQKSAERVRQYNKFTKEMVREPLS